MISSWFAALGITLLLALAFFLALIDVAFDYFSKISLRTYHEEGWKLKYLTRSLEDPMSFLLPLRIGLQGAFMGITVLVTMLFLSSTAPQPLLLAFGTMIAIFLVFRETFPNIIARKNPERVLLKLLPAFRVYSKLVTPISRPLFRFVGAFIHESENDEAPTDEDVQAFIEAGEEEGILEGDEGRMVQSIVDLGDKVVREVMTPRPEMVAIRHNASLRELRALFTKEKHARVPVYRDSLDHIEGLIFAIDLIAFLEANPDAAITSLIRDVSFVPETKKVAALLAELQKTNQTLTMVVDEYGGISGLVTVEDILEEIVGEIHDEFDEVDEEIVKEREGVFLVSGRADIDDVKEQLHFEVNGTGFETVSGYVLDSIGRIPRVGEVIENAGLRIEVVDADGQRINKVRFRLEGAS
ncbi:MAG: HlyC/CorC family transporter [Acidobacteria bacterium]|nr:MAG: HlyC/CorC family transporter [Acidobacteriota bacterium]